MTFAPTSIEYDARIFSFREQDWTVSLTLLHGRARLAMCLGTYQRGKLKGQQTKAAQLCKHRDGTYAVHIQLHLPVDTPPTSDKAIGIDLGRRDIAHTSTGQSWAGDDITRVRDRYARLRRGLQYKASKGTRLRLGSNASVLLQHFTRSVKKYRIRRRRTTSSPVMSGCPYPDVLTSHPRYEALGTMFRPLPASTRRWTREGRSGGT